MRQTTRSVSHGAAQAFSLAFASGGSGTTVEGTGASRGTKPVGAYLCMGIVVTFALVACAGSDGGGMGSSGTVLGPGTGTGGAPPNGFFLPSTNLVGCENRSCSCAAMTQCAWDCAGGDCNMGCAAGSTCDLHCAAGHCRGDCAATGKCAVDCSGGGCNLECSSLASCHIGCQTGDCIIKCAAGAKCDVDCQQGGCTIEVSSTAQLNLNCAGGGCNVDCGASATCTLACPSGKCTCNTSSGAKCQ